MLELGPRIAIVEDDALVRKALVRLLETAYCVADYASATSLLSAINHRPPQCLIADLQMPIMTGFELLCHLNRAGIFIPTIIITAYDEPGTRAMCIAGGVSAYLLKPVRRAVLMKTVNELLQSERGL